jgi:CheY-like chemotaxis protein
MRFIGTDQDITARRRPEADELLWQVTKDLSTEVTSLRRTIGRLRPLVLVEDGLEAALREEAKSACNRAALVSCEVVSELEERPDPVVETALFRVAQQALANVVDHAGATHARHRPLRSDRHAGTGGGAGRPLPGDDRARPGDGGRGQAAPDPSGRVDVGSVSLPRVLVVDDHAMLREALVELLVQAGFEVAGQAADGVDAVALAKQLEPDVVLMGLRMPVLGGLDATRLIKEGCPETQVVLLSAFESPALEQQAEAAGCFAYLVKGVAPGTIRLVLHQAVASRRSLLPPAGSAPVDA